MSKKVLRWTLILALAHALLLKLGKARLVVPGDRLDFLPRYHISQHARGGAAAAWLNNETAVIPRLKRSKWPQHLVIGYASGYDFQVLKPLIYSFLANTDHEAWLVLLIQDDDVLELPPQVEERVVVQRHAVPRHLEDPEDIPYPVSLRFYVTNALLQRIQHTGTVFFLDTRDVYIQSDPFLSHADGIMHFPQESGSYKLKGPYTNNHQWLLLCFGNETSEAIGGHFVLNSGTIIGPSVMMRKYFELLLHELEHRWHCRRLHGSDQAIHNYLVYTGKLVRSGIVFQVEDQISGQFAFIAYSHPRVFDFRYVSETREEMYNIGNGQPMVAIHLWPGDNRAATKVVWPFVREFESQLNLASKWTSGN